MLINEDYFKDITDDDIKIEDSSYTSIITLDSITQNAKQKYQNTIQIIFDSDCYLYRITDEFLNKIAKHMNILLDIYNIQHSPMYVLSGYYNNNNPKLVTINQHANYIDVINNEEDETPDYNTDNHAAIIYIDYPKFSNIKMMMFFIKGLMNVLYKHQLLPIIRDVNFFDDIREIFHDYNHNTLNLISIMFDEYWKINKAFDIYIKNKDSNSQSINTSVMYFMTTLNRWFFGRKTANNFETKWLNYCIVDFKPVPDDQPYNTFD